MKFTTINFLFLIASICFTSCNQKTDIKSGIDPQKLNETFKSIAKQENLDFYKKDFQSWSKHFVHSNSVYWICVEDEVTLRATGWDDLNKFVSQWMKENPKPDSDTLLKQDTINDFQVELSDDIAFVRYKKNHMMPDGNVKILLENRTFKLIDNEWKILGMTSAPGYGTPKSTTNVFIHNDLSK